MNENPACFGQYLDSCSVGNCPQEMKCRIAKFEHLQKIDVPSCTPVPAGECQACDLCAKKKEGVLKLFLDKDGEEIEVWDANALLYDMASHKVPILGILDVKTAKHFHQHGCETCEAVLKTAEELGAEYVLVHFPSKMNGGRVPDIIAVVPPTEKS